MVLMTSVQIFQKGMEDGRVLSLRETLIVSLYRWKIRIKINGWISLYDIKVYAKLSGIQDCGDLQERGHIHLKIW